MRKITPAQYRALGNPRKKLSKANEERIAKGLDPIESEDAAQQRLVTYLGILFEAGRVLKFTAIPNNTYTPSKRQMVKNRDMGLRQGLCDLLVAGRCADGANRLLFLEMKREDGGRLKPEQKEWIRVLNSCLETEAVVASGYDEAVSKINSFLYRERSKIPLH